MWAVLEWLLSAFYIFLLLVVVFFTLMFYHQIETHGAFQRKKTE